MNELIPSLDHEFLAAVNAIQQPRTDHELKTFVVGHHDTDLRRWAQCVLEEHQKWLSLRRAEISERKLIRKIAWLKARGAGENPDIEPKRRADSLDDAETAEIDLEELRLASLGAARELVALDAIRLSFGRSYTREELNAAEPEYWTRRLTRQAIHDINASGRVGVGNQDAMRMAGMATPLGLDYVREVEQRMLSQSSPARILITVPTMSSREEVQANGLACLSGWSVPGTIEQRVFCVNGRPVDEAYNTAAEEALSNDATHLLCVEDDMQIPPGAFEQLWKRASELGPQAIVGGWYPQRRHPRTGTSIILRDGRRDYLTDDGELHEVLTVPQGFTLIPVPVFRQTPRPWFVTTGTMTQDSFFCQVARDAGYRSFCDTSIRCQHVDRNTKEVFA